MRILMIFWLCLMVYMPVLAQDSDQTKPVLVTTQPLPRGTILTIEVVNSSVEVQFWSDDLAPTTAIQDTNEILGKVVSLDLAVRTPILAGAIVEQTPATAAIGSDTALITPEDFLSVPLIVENLYVAPPTLAELDCVNVSGIFDFGDGLVSEFIFAENAIVTENAYQIGAEVVSVAMPAAASVIAVWLQDHHIPIALVYC